jgi:hypothetical protein
MTRKLILEVPEEVYDFLSGLAEGVGQQPERLAADWLVAVAQAMEGGGALAGPTPTRSRTKRTVNSIDAEAAEKEQTTGTGPAGKGRRAGQSGKDSIYQLKVTLKGSSPPIWRRIQVPSNISLEKLHGILQVVMGWYDCHLHQFKAHGAYYGTRDRDLGIGWGVEVRSERAAKLSQIAPTEKSRFTYEYDFGDSWEHDILVEKIMPPEEGVSYPICIKGKRACPPEDVGGIWGYDSFLEAMQDPKHPEHEDMLEWVGGSFDPEEFDLEGVNRALKSMR